MIRITHVLCPVDFSDVSRHALDHAAAIAHWYRAKLTLLFVVATVPALDVPPLPLDQADRDRLTAAMRKLAGGVPADVPIDCRVVESAFVHGEIVAQVPATQADLLVLGTHGRSGFQHLFLGSVTEKVIRKATCPVLVVPPRAADVAPSAPVRYRRIVAPVDFSDSSLAAVTHALQLAEEADAHLTLLHVVEITAGLRMDPDAAAAVDFDRIGAAVAAEARRRLEALVPDRARTYCTVETTVVEGRAHRQILQWAAGEQADLIVMGASGHGAIDHLAFGSTTHHVIRAAACPVLIVRG